ncbi:hypothetical protein Plhal703r1_c24g0102761 [Plasmopara halstedii]
MAKPHVVLYFDVNKTIIMHDPMQGKSLHHVLNDLLTERALGRVLKESNADPKWVWNGERILERKLPIQKDDDGLMSYGEFLRAKYPLSDNPETAKKNKDTRRTLRLEFTSEGNPGEGLEIEHEKLLQHLLLPRTEASDAHLHELGLSGSSYFFIVPAFFRLLEYLQTNDFIFNIIFRTFGDDLRRVAQEFNCFCEGRHPYFPLMKPMDGSDGSVDRRIYLDGNLDGNMPRFGTFLRTRCTTALIMGSFEQPEATIADPLAFYTSQNNHVKIMQGILQIHHFLVRRWRNSQATLALRDYYPYWFSNGEVATAGKLLLVDRADSTEGIHAMFFDDNILLHDAHIVDVRDAHNGAAQPFEETRELHLMRVEPLDVIQNTTYFIDRFNASLQRAMNE